jgi:hypothetical protein
MGWLLVSKRENPELMHFSDYGNIWVYRADLKWQVYEAYKQQVTPEESNFHMLTHVYEAMVDWGEKNARGQCWNDGILGIGFTDEGDAIRFKLTFMRPNHILDQMFKARKHTYSEH